MKRTRWLMVGMALILYFGVEPGFADFLRQGESFWINPAYRQLMPEEPVSRDELRVSPAAEICASPEEIVLLLKEKYNSRVTDFAFDMVFDFDVDDVGIILGQADAEAMAGDDYLKFSIRSIYRSWIGYGGRVSVTWQAEYLTTHEQEQQVDARVNEILGFILHPGMNHEEQLKAIHDWIVINVAYDDETYQKYSAWDALFTGRAVCQGYALLTCNMLQKCNIPVRIINSAAMNHAWNMVYLCGHWYHLDVTWNDPTPDVPGRILYTYYNLSDEEISQGPNPHEGWSADAPEASISYVAGVCADMPAAAFSLEDVIMILKVCANVASVSQANLMNLDANGDGCVGLEDALYILRNIAGMETPSEGLLKSADKPFSFIIRDQIRGTILSVTKPVNTISFPGRADRFGKSLFITTLKEAFEGNRAMGTKAFL